MFYLKKDNLVKGLIIMLAIILAGYSYKNKTSVTYNEEAIINYINDKEETITSNDAIAAEEIPIAMLEISKINLFQAIYNIESENNDVDKGLFLVGESLFPDSENSNVIIAGHSGTGKYSYFNNLDELEEEDIVILHYDGNQYFYEITLIEEQEKTGIISLPKSNVDIISLITCSKDNELTQLVYYGKLVKITEDDY